MIMPPQYNARLRYTIETVLTNVGAVQTSLQYRTECFDVDPNFASTAMPGFTEFAAFYQRYRVLNLGYKFSVANQEAFSVAVIHGSSALAIAAGSLNIQYAGNPLFTTGLLGPASGQNRAVFTRSSSIVSIVGTKQPLVDDLYTGSTTSATLATAGTCYCYLGIISPVILTALGVLVIAEVTMDVQFYRIRPLLV
jgi:hypothetical protein